LVELLSGEYFKKTFAKKGRIIKDKVKLNMPISGTIRLVIFVKI